MVSKVAIFIRLPLIRMATLEAIEILGFFFFSNKTDLSHLSTQEFFCEQATCISSYFLDGATVKSLVQF